MRDVVIVVIGRNEASRLSRCLDSLVPSGHTVVYVDSGSSDGSPAVAAAKGVLVHELDPRLAFSAARARNEGFARAEAIAPGVEFVQFVDGDCVVHPGWLDAAASALGEDSGLAAVCGRLREIDRERSIYNRLCDLEWDAPPGETQSCGGIAMYRVAAFRDAGGFLPSIRAGEEPELCFRLRARGWRIRRLAAEMAAHDAAMTRFRQWWKRAMRGGWAYAAVGALHGGSPARFRVRENLSITLYGLVLPALALGLSVPSAGVSLALLVAYPALVWKVYRRSLVSGRSRSDAALQSAFTALAKFPEAWGQLQYVLERLRAEPGRSASR